MTLPLLPIVFTRICRKKSIPVAALVAACVVAFSIGAFFFRPGREPAPEKEVLKVAEDALDFGEVWEQKNFRWSLPLQNTTSEPLEITGFSASCRCVSLEPGSLTIPPNQTRTVNMTIDLTGRAPEELDVSVRSVVITVIPHLRGQVLQHGTWVMKGEVRSAVTLRPNALDFKESLVHGSQAPSQSVEATCHVPLRDLKVRCDNPLVSIKTVGEVKEGDKVVVQVTPQSDFPEGIYKFGVEFIPIDREGRQLPPITLPVTGRAVEGIQAVPSSISFGTKRVNDTVSEVIVLQSLNGDPFSVEDLEVDKDITVEIEARKDLPGKAFRITQKVSETGPQQRNVIFLVNTKEGRQIKVRASLCYFGVSG